MAATLKPTALFTLEEIKAWMKIDATDTRRDDVLAQIGNAVTARVERETNRIVVSRVVTEVRDGNGRPTLLLRQTPVLAVDSVTVDEEALDLADFVYATGTGALHLTARLFRRGWQNVTVVYTAGHAAEDVPDDVKVAALDLVKFFHDQWDTGAIAVETLSLPSGATLNRAADVPKQIRDVLRAWRRPNL